MTANFVFGSKPVQSQAQPRVSPVDGILRDLGPNSTFADVTAAIGVGRNATALRRTYSRVENETFRGSWTSDDGTERFAVFSDDGCTVTFTPRDGGQPVIAVARFGIPQDLFDTRNSLQNLVNFIPVKETTYDIEVRYSNTHHTGPQDIDGLTLFIYRDRSAPAEPEEYDPRIAHDELTSTSVRVFWQAPSDLVSYTLFRDTQREVRMTDATRVHTGTAAQFRDNGLNAATSYFYKLRVRRNVAGTEVTRDFVPHEVKTAADEFRVTFTGSHRALAGHKQNEVHIATLQARVEVKNEEGNFVLAPQKDLGLILRGNGGIGQPARLLRREQNGSETPVNERLLVRTNEVGEISVRVLSSQAISNSIVVAVQANMAPAATPPATPEWEDIGRHRLEFAAAESRRLWNDGNWQSNFAQDTGWHFERLGSQIGSAPNSQTYVSNSVFSGQNQIIRGRIFLHFRTSTTRAVDEDYSGHNESSSAVNGADGQLLWLPVEDHLVQVRLQDLQIPNDTMTAPVAGLTSRVLSFCNAEGVPVKDDSAAQGAWQTVNEDTPLPAYITVKVTNGVGTFYLKSNRQIHQTTQINLSAKDVTIIR